MSTQELLREQEDSLAARLRLSADTLEIDGSGPRTVCPPAPSGLIVQGRRTRTRRRVAVGSAGLAASVLVAGAGVGVMNGTWVIPGLREQRVGPAALEASRGSRVGDLINDIDQGFSSYVADDRSLEQRTWNYHSGPAVAPDLDDQLAEARTDRSIRLVKEGGTGAGVKTEFTFTWRDLTQGLSASAERRLGTLKLGADGRGQWMRVRPSAADGWLVLAVLPQGASSPQFRLEGSDVVLPLSEERVETSIVCLDGPDAIELGQDADEGSVCTGMPDFPVLRVRIATTDAKPPIDGITYIDKDGRYVVLGPEAQVH